METIKPFKISEDLVGAAGFELATPCAQGRCATRLRYAPTGLTLSHVNGANEANENDDPNVSNA